ncbi:ribosome recycling factor [Allofustis seminis]|uniref:ribosome recycling factor n=1 Tax=Allofustis seminis TaxID=166939 RepID=UPI000382C0C8|nr:ribosome recycling factor [Allofustis seminis]
MDVNLKDTEKRMQQSIQSLLHELGGIRAGRANASLLDRINVMYYGAETPLNQMAQITVPEARVLMISPYDKSSLSEIEKAINQSDLDIPPANDGNVIRLVIPALTEERRRQIAKQVGEVAEDAKVAIRNIRRSAIDEVKKAEKAGDISQDEQRQYEKDIQDLTDKYVGEVDQHADEKEKEIMDQ